MPPSAQPSGLGLDVCLIGGLKGRDSDHGKTTLANRIAALQAARLTDSIPGPSDRAEEFSPFGPTVGILG